MNIQTKFNIGDKLKYINQTNDQNITEFIVTIYMIRLSKDNNDNIVIEYIFRDFPDISRTSIENTTIYTYSNVSYYINEKNLVDNPNVILLMQ